MRIALIHNAKPAVRREGLPEDYYSECDAPETVRAITQALEARGDEVLPVEADRRLPAWLQAHPVDLAFNIAEGFSGPAREARVPALLELLEIPYTGAGVLTLALALDKAKSKLLFRSAGVPTPRFQVFTDPQQVLCPELSYPLIVKPNREGSGKGIWASSVVRDEAALRAHVRLIFERYGQEALVEEFIEGMELTVGILAEEVLPVLEVDFSRCGPSGEFFYSWRMKEYQGDAGLNLTPRFWCPARLAPERTRAVEKVAWAAAAALDARELARVDIRLHPDGIPYVLEVNPLPGLDPEESNLPMMVRAAGLSYETLIHRLVDRAMERTMLKEETIGR